MFVLHYNKKYCELIIESWGGIECHLEDNEIKWWNEFCYLSNNRKLLREKAKELQDQWIKETEEYLDKLKNIKVKTKYK